jgi:hypothetical protein
VRIVGNASTLCVFECLSFNLEDSKAPGNIVDTAGMSFYTRRHLGSGTMLERAIASSH